MTTVPANTFKGPNQGITNGYTPHTEINSNTVDADFGQILMDLDTHVALLETAFAKLDLLDPTVLNTLTANEVLTALNNSGIKISKDNLDDLVVLVSELNAAIETHRTTTNTGSMHPAVSIQNANLSYSYTPTSIITTCMNLQDELKNLRYQINRVVGKTNWCDTPDSSLADLKTLLLADITNLSSHISNNAPHLNVEQKEAMIAANYPSSQNAFATMNDLAAKGAGDMLRSVYDPSGNNYVKKAGALVDGAAERTYTDITNKISADIAAHANATAVTQYTDVMARGAVHNDANHSSSTVHDYNDLINKPTTAPSTNFTSSNVNYLMLGKLANGDMPWLAKADLVGGFINFGQCQNIQILGSSWLENYTVTNSYYSATTAGSVLGTIPGPAFIFGGIATATQDFGFIEIGVNDTNYTSVTLSHIMVNSPGEPSAKQLMWFCPQVYVPAGKGFNIKAGSTHTDANGTICYGAGFTIKYRLLV